MNELWIDLRYAIRAARKNPAFTLIAILVLALGIGATTAIFSVVNAVLIRAIPYRDPARLVAFSSVGTGANPGRSYPTLTLNQVEAFRAQTRSLESIGSFVFTALPVNVGSQAFFPAAIGADPELLQTLGVTPDRGHTLPGNGSQTREHSAVISHHFWLEAFSGDPRVLGRTFTMDGDEMVVAGVLPASFRFPRTDISFFPREPDLLFPVANIADTWGRDSSQWVAIGRLAPGVSIAQADSELKTIAARLAAADRNLAGTSVHIARLDAETTASVRTALLSTLGISIVLLLIACTNIMNLLFSRGAQRGREMAIRKAVGASNGRLIRQMLRETAFLTFFAGAIGIALARLALDTLVGLSPAHLPLTGEIGIDWSVLGFAFFVCAGASVFAGAVPAFLRSRQTEALIASNRSSGSRALAGFQRALMVSQIALGVGLLAAGGLLAHSLFRLSSVNPGFRTEGTLGFELAFPSGRPKDTQRIYQHVLDAVRGVSGVTSAGWITHPPPETRAGVFVPFSLPGASKMSRFFGNMQVTSEDYFRTAGIPLVRGRDLTAGDTETAGHVAIVNETLARRFFPNADAIGRHIYAGFGGASESNDREVVGIIGDVHDRGLSAKPVPTVYLPYRQFSLAYGGVLVRTSVAPASVASEIRRRIAAVEPTVPLTNFMTTDARLSRTLDAPRFYTVMAATCALMAVLFVTLGLYGVISYGVSRRTSEIGIRMALGAQTRSILWDVLMQGLRMATIGIVLGLGLSIAATRLLATLLFEIKAIDPLSLTASVLVVFAVTILASYFPARRASQVHPLLALRHE